AQLAVEIAPSVLTAGPLDVALELAVFALIGVHDEWTPPSWQGSAACNFVEPPDDGERGFARADRCRTGPLSAEPPALGANYSQGNDDRILGQPEPGRVVCRSLHQVIDLRRAGRRVLF